MQTKLREFLLGLPMQERKDFAKKCNTTYAYLVQVYRGNRQCSADLAIEIDKNSGGVVRCDDLHPKADFDYLRGQTYA